eukprot:2471830-Prymnesium_polylepis.1
MAYGLWCAVRRSSSATRLCGPRAMSSCLDVSTRGRMRLTRRPSYVSHVACRMSMSMSHVHVACTAVKSREKGPESDLPKAKAMFEQVKSSQVN